MGIKYPEAIWEEEEHGGRWNPPDLFPVIYLAVPQSACMREFEKLAADNHIGVADQLRVPYNMHTIRLEDIPVLDLRDEVTWASLGLEADDITGSWDACQPIGHAAWFLEFAGVLAPSSTEAGLTLALFEHRARPEHIHVEKSERLTFDVYRQHTG